eukprot:g2874.t1
MPVPPQPAAAPPQQQQQQQQRHDSGPLSAPPGPPPSCRPPLGEQLEQQRARLFRERAYVEIKKELERNLENSILQLEDLKQLLLGTFPPVVLDMKVRDALCGGVVEKLGGPTSLKRTAAARDRTESRGDEDLPGALEDHSSPAMETADQEVDDGDAGGKKKVDSVRVQETKREQITLEEQDVDMAVEESVACEGAFPGRNPPTRTGATAGRDEPPEFQKLSHRDQQKMIYQTVQQLAKGLTPAATTWRGAFSGIIANHRNLSRKDYTSTGDPPPPVQRTLSSGSSINQVVEYLQSFNQKPLQANWFQSLGLAEFSSRELKERFDELDVDEDGYLSEKDLKDLVAKYHAKWYPPRQSAMGGNVSRLNLTEKERRKMEEREERRRLRMERRILEMFRSVGVGSRETDSGGYSLHQNGNGTSTSTGNASGTTTGTPTRSKLESSPSTTSAPPLLGSMGSTEKKQENERQREFRISREQWVRTMRALAEKVDHRIYPIAVSCFMTGATLGILTPVIPFLSEKLQLTKAQFGLYVASFAATKIFANIPAAFLVERYGRKPFFVFPYVFKKLKVT